MKARPPASTDQDLAAFDAEKRAALVRRAGRTRIAGSAAAEGSR